MKRYSIKVLAVFICCLSLSLCSQEQKKETGKYRRLLADSRYAKHQPQDFPDFTYESPDDKNLSALRRRYSLDRIAGKGPDLSKITNLLRWMHDTVPHEDEENLPVLNAEHIIETYRKKGTAQGCYPLAIAMNEIFLSMGFVSRIIICFPADSGHPNGGHVINSIYVPSLRKWIWADPQYNAFVKDEKGNLLGVQEVRERITSGKPLSLNDGANYHNEKITVSYYIDEFMTEHLYRMISPLHSGFNTETRTPGKMLQYVELLPENPAEKYKGMFETHEGKDVRVITWYTSNPEVFWKSPE